MYDKVEHVSVSRHAGSVAVVNVLLRNCSSRRQYALTCTVEDEVQLGRVFMAGGENYADFQSCPDGEILERVLNESEGEVRRALK